MADGAEKTHAKSELRQLLRRQRAEKYEAHSLLHNLLHIADIAEVKAARVIASYFSYGDEPNTRDLNQKLIAAGKTLLLPRVNGQNLEWVRWSGSADEISHQHLIPEPTGDAISDTASIEVVLVPALAIDPAGYRLGQGKGFYDRALKDLQAFTLGIVYAHELRDEPLPRDPWDIPLRKSASPL